MRTSGSPFQNTPLPVVDSNLAAAVNAAANEDSLAAVSAQLSNRSLAVAVVVAAGPSSSVVEEVPGQTAVEAVVGRRAAHTVMAVAAAASLAVAVVAAVASFAAAVGPSYPHHILLVVVVADPSYHHLAPCHTASRKNHFDSQKQPSHPEQVRTTS